MLPSLKVDNSAFFILLDRQKDFQMLGAEKAAPETYKPYGERGRRGSTTTQMKAFMPVYRTMSPTFTLYSFAYPAGSSKTYLAGTSGWKVRGKLPGDTF